jgi:hypothetical protein
MKKYQKGFSSLNLVFILIILLALVSAGSFYYLKFQGKINPSDFSFMQEAVPSPKPTSSGISTSTEIPAVERELDGTAIDSIDQELDEMESSASSL